MVAVTTSPSTLFPLALPFKLERTSIVLTSLVISLACDPGCTEVLLFLLSWRLKCCSDGSQGGRADGGMLGYYV